MKIGGIQKLSLIDYPGRLSIVLFTIGCNFRCYFCHNPSLVIPEKYVEPMNNEEIINFLEDRKKYVQGVVITGGEPTLQSDLVDFTKKIKKMGYLIKLDTNGTNPKMVKQLIDEKLIDFVAMDIKTSIEKYDEVTNVKSDKDKILQSINLLKNSGILHEFRTTVAPGVGYEDIEKICELTKGSEYFLQPFECYRRELINNEMQKAKAKTIEELKDWCIQLNKNGFKCKLR